MDGRKFETNLNCQKECFGVKYLARVGDVLPGT